MLYEGRLQCNVVTKAIKKEILFFKFDTFWVYEGRRSFFGALFCNSKCFQLCSRCAISPSSIIASFVRSTVDFTDNIAANIRRKLVQVYGSGVVSRQHVTKKLDCSEKDTL